MRRLFVKLIKNKLDADKNIHLLTADLGFGMYNDFPELYQGQFHNVGAAEQLMVGAGIGLALGGKIPLCYSITPFLLYRPFEFLRNYLDYERIPVKLVGAGRDKDYSHDGISHWAEDDEKILSCLPNIKIYKPKDEDELCNIFNEFIHTKEPSYLNLKR